MLRQRVITGVLLALAFLAAVYFLRLEALAIIFGAVAAAGAWEWSGLSGIKSVPLRVSYTLTYIGLLALTWVALAIGNAPSPEVFQPWLGSACFFWSVVMLMVESYPGTAWIWRSRMSRAVFGLFILTTTWLSTIFLLTMPSGTELLILMVLAVALADIGAYFVGRRWGRHKLAIRVSPGKTWEGFFGGVASVVVLTCIVAYMLPQHMAHLSLVTVTLLGLAVAGASVLGDLTVSMVKRESGVKDSGRLLPGHGGLLDRIDGLCAAAPVFGLGLLLAGY
ncbi:phosphatidate cytidylyltransferase [Luminiphilus sp. nBUS_16]|uniref:phosphatidate cytidylyltransferase n=1 Tax=Luminiphilus sp. nBUS_16 TaxID=3395315 RepID=UPI003EBD1DE8